MNNYKIIISKDAKKDIYELYNYIAENDLPGKAEFLLTTLEEKIHSLSILPHRGKSLNEYKKPGHTDCHEIYYKSYRIIYQILDSNVIIQGVLDGRRDVKKLLIKRLNNTILEIV